MQEKMAEVTNLEGKNGTLADALKGADIFVGVSAPGIVTADMVKSMNKEAILFAIANLLHNVRFALTTIFANPLIMYGSPYRHSVINRGS